MLMDKIINKLNNKEWIKIKKYILEDKIDWDYSVNQIDFPLHYLAHHNKLDLIKMVNFGIMKKIINQPNIDGDTVAHIAARFGNLDLFNYILELNPDILYSSNRLSYTPLHYLVDDHKLIKQIAKKLKIKDHYLNDAYTLIEYYVYSNHIPMIKFLLNNLEIDKRENYIAFSTIKSDNSTEDKLEILDILAKHQFDFNKLDNLFLSLLIVATTQNNYRVVEFLLDHGADINYYGPENNDNPLIIAIRNSNIPTIKLLLKFGAESNVPDQSLMTPIHHGFLNDIPHKIRIKLLRGINNINLVDNQMNSVLNLMIHTDNWRKYQDILERKKLDIYLKNKSNIRPIDGIKDEDYLDFMNLVYRSYLNQLNSYDNWVDDIDSKVSIAIRNNENWSSYKTLLKEKITRQSYPLKKKNNHLLKLLIPPKTNIGHFSAYTYNYICFLYYILEKYPDIKIPFLDPQTKPKKLYYSVADKYRTDPDGSTFRSILKDYINHSPFLINHIIIWRDNEMYFIPPQLIESLQNTVQKYPDTKLIIIKLTIVNTNNLIHANILIYDVPNKQIERFDPYGKVPFIKGDQIDNLLSSFFENNLPEITYISLPKILNGVSFQIFSDENNTLNYVENDSTGFCTAWCIWYVESRIKNPNIKPKSLIKRTIYQINKNEIKFKDYIRDYSNYLDIEKNHILEQASVPREYWYKLNMPRSIYHRYLEYIRNLYRNIS